MRRTRIILLVVLLLAILAACGGSDGSPTTTSAQTSPTATATATSAAAATGAGTVVATAGSSGTPATVASPAASAATPARGSASPSSSPSSGSSGNRGSFAYGFNVFARGDRDGAAFNQQVIQAVDTAGFGWVRLPILWADVEYAKNQWDPAAIDRLVNQFHGSGIQILATVSKAPEWARDPSGRQFLTNYSDFEGFMHFLAERYRGKIAAYEIWNEQNLAENMGGRVRVDDYCGLLQGGHRGVKLADSSALVVFGGLTPTGVNDPAVAIDDVAYLEAFYATRGGACATFFDVLGVHVNATNHPPDKLYPDNPGTGGWSNHPSFYFRRAEQIRTVMATVNDRRPVWITEFGWTTANQAKGYEYGNDVTEQQQADYLVGAFRLARTQWPWVTGMFVWNLNYSVITEPSDEKYPWSVLNRDWSPRPAYNALRAMPKN